MTLGPKPETQSLKSISQSGMVSGMFIWNMDEKLKEIKEFTVLVAGLWWDGGMVECIDRKVTCGGDRLEIVMYLQQQVVVQVAPTYAMMNKR